VTGSRLQLLPSDTDAPPTTWERIRFLLVVLLPWLAIYEWIAHLHLAGTPFQFAFEDRLPIFPWTAPVYQSIYGVAVAAPWMARSRADLRKLTISAWLAIALIFPFYCLVPSAAPRRPLAVTSWITRVLAWERNTYPPSEAFPSFHVLWAIFLARLFRPLWAGVLYAAAVSVTCITTGMHYIPDVLASFAIAPFFLAAPEWLGKYARRRANGAGRPVAPQLMPNK
jgi:hypothetical protein